MISIRRRLIVFFVIIVTLVLGVSGAYSYYRSRSELATDLRHSGESLKSRLETSLPAPLWNFDDYQLDRILDSEMLSPKIGQIVIENNGKFVNGRRAVHNNRAERLTSTPSKKGDELEFDVFYQDNFERAIGKVTVRLSSEPMDEQLRRIVLEKIIEILLLDMVILLALTRSITYLFVRPLEQLHNMLSLAADQTDEGKTDAAIHLPDSPYAEFSDLTSVYNRIARRLLKDLLRRREAEDEMRVAKDAAEAAYRQLRDAQASLVQSEKMASLGGLVAGIAHEINTPVGIILTGASVLSEESSMFKKNVDAGTVKKSDVLHYTEMATQSANLILTNAERAASLIQSFKRVAVDQTSEARRSFELKEYLDEVVLSLRPAIKHNAINIQIDCDEKIDVDGYPGAISQIVTNMITNAIHHAFEDGKPGTIQISGRNDRGMIRLIFTDNGRGIQPEHLGRIFDPFFTTRRGSGGSGLGLNIVYNLVTQTLGGTIAVTSSPGNGACFTVAFPRISPEHLTQIH